MQNIEITDHESKAQIMYNFHKSIMGANSATHWDFDLFHLYSGSVHQQSQDLLVQPFSMQEVVYALIQMDWKSTPGPDDFGPSFYKSAWATVSQVVMRMMNSFFEERCYLGRINRACIVLVPKLGKTTPDGYNS